MNIGSNVPSTSSVFGQIGSPRKPRIRRPRRIKSSCCAAELPLPASARSQTPFFQPFTPLTTMAGPSTVYVGNLNFDTPASGLVTFMELLPAHGFLSQTSCSSLSR